MNACEKVQSQLALFVNEELPAQRAERVAQHLAGCASCRAEAEAYRRLAQRLRALPEPTLPEHAQREFTQAVLAELAPQRQAAPTHKLRGLWLQPRWRYAWAGMATMLFILAIGLWYAPFERRHPELAPLLQTRAWDKIYYALSAEESRARLLHEPVPAALLKTAVAELLKKGERDQRVRVGVQRLLSALSGRSSTRAYAPASAKIMGVVTTRGYIPPPRVSAEQEEARMLLHELQALPDNGQITLAEIVLKEE